MRVIIEPSYDLVCQWSANYIVQRINEFGPSKTNPFVLGLNAASDLLGMYKELIKLNKAGLVSFKDVVTFNMSEYVNLEQEHPACCHLFMWNHFFGHIDIPEENINIPDGNAPDFEKECLMYEEEIDKLGGVDIFVGGLGSSGQIAFNEPGSSLSSRTRVKMLSNETIKINSQFFNGNIDEVPEAALTVGVGTILEAEEVMIIVRGQQRADVLRCAVEESVNHMCTVSSLQTHPKGIIVCDEESTVELKVGTVNIFKDIESAGLDPSSLLNTGDNYRCQ